MMKNNLPTPADRFQMDERHPNYHPHHHAHLMPPHMHHARMRLTFEEQDWERILSPWNDEDSKAAVCEIIYRIAPPEMQILVDQWQILMARLEAGGLIKTREALDTSENMIADHAKNHINSHGWSNPVLTGEIRSLYEDVYGEAGKAYLEMLETSPFEVSAISTLLAFMMARVEVE